MLTHEKDLLVLFGATFFCPNLAFLFDFQGLVKRSWLWKTKISVWQFRSCVPFRYRWQAIRREESRLQNASFKLRNLKLSRPEVLPKFFELLCK